MRCVVRLFHALHCHMRINLCRREVGVAKQRLNTSQIGAVIQKMRGEAVAKLMRTDL